MDSRQRHTGMEGAEYGMIAPASSHAPAAAPAFHFDVMRSVRMHRKIAVMTALAVFLGTVLYALTRKPMYKAESLTYIEPLTTKVVSDGSGGIYDPARYDSYIQQQIQTAEREDILEAAIAKLPEGTWQLPQESPAEAAVRLANSLKIARVGSSYQLSISLSGSDPEKTAAIVNAVTDTYLAKGRKDENALADGRLQLLHEESDRIQNELTQDRAEQATLSKTLGVADPVGATANPYDAQLVGVRTELTAAREAHDVAAAQLASVGTGNPAGAAAVADDAIASDAGLVALKASINQRRATLSSQMAGLTNSNPLYKQDQEELADLDREVETKAAQLRRDAEQRLEDKLRLELRRTGDVEARLNAQLAQGVATAGSAAPKLQRASELSADITRLEARYATVDDALRGLEIESNGPGTAHLSVAAAVPTAPEANRKMLLLMLALPLALFAGAAAAVVARKRDVRVYTNHDVEAELGVAPLCAVPATHEVSARVMEEYLLRLAAGLERGYRLNGARSFVFTAVTDATETETFVNELSERLEKLGFRAIGLPASEVLRSDEVGSGRAARGRSTEGRNNGIVVAKLEKLKQDHDLVLIAAEPLLHSAAAEYAASAADATFLLIESGVTTRMELEQAMLLLRKLKARGVGTVLNGVQAKFEEPSRRTSIEVIERKLAKPARPQTVENLAAIEEKLPQGLEQEANPVAERLDQVIAPRRRMVQAADPVVAVAPMEAEPNPAMEILSEAEIVAEETTMAKRFEEKHVERAVVPAEPVVRFAEAPVVRKNEFVEMLKRASIVAQSEPRFSEAAIKSEPAKRVEFAENVTEAEVVAEAEVATEREFVAPIQAEAGQEPETEAERKKREMIARVREKFSPPAVYAAKAIEATVPEAVEDLAPVAETVAKPDVHQATMLAWGMMPKKQKPFFEETMSPEVHEEEAEALTAVETNSVEEPVSGERSAEEIPIERVEAAMEVPAEAVVETPALSEDASSETADSPVATEENSVAAVREEALSGLHQADELIRQEEEFAARLEAFKVEAGESGRGELAIVPPAWRLERRSRPRVPVARQGLNRAAHAMPVRPETRPAFSTAGPRLTAEEEAVARMTESGRHRVVENVGQSVEPNVVQVADSESSPQVAAPKRRWGLLSRFDGPLGTAYEEFEQDRAAV